MVGSSDDLKMMGNTVALVSSSPVAYDAATRTSSGATSRAGSLIRHTNWKTPQLTE